MPQYIDSGSFYILLVFHCWLLTTVFSRQRTIFTPHIVTLARISLHQFPSHGFNGCACVEPETTLHWAFCLTKWGDNTPLFPPRRSLTSRHCSLQLLASGCCSLWLSGSCLDWHQGCCLILSRSASLNCWRPCRWSTKRFFAVDDRVRCKKNM